MTVSERSIVRLSTLLSWVAGGVFIASVVYALAIPGRHATTWISVPVAASATTTQSDHLLGIMAHGVPAWRPHWTGRPPFASIVDDNTGLVVAPSALSRASFESNSSAVFWTPNDDYTLTRLRVEWKLPATTSIENKSLRFETTPNRAPAGRVLGAGLAGALVLGALAVLLRRLRRNPAAPPFAAAAAPWLAVAMACVAGWLRFMSPMWRSGDTDAGTISSFAAVRANPDAFSTDALLSDPASSSWYTGLYVRLAEWVAGAGFEHTQAFALIAFTGTLLGVLGFYRLFTRLSGSEPFGLALGVALMSISIGYPPNEHWTFGQALPRSLFVGVLPWILLVLLRVYRWRRQWPLLGLCAGATMYIHPVSSPVLLGGLGMTLLFVGGHRASIRHWIGLGAFVLGAAIALAPFSADYIARAVARESLEIGASPLAVLAVPEFLRTMRPSNVVSSIAQQSDLIVRFAAFSLTIWWATNRYRRTGRALVAGAAGTLIVALGVPSLDWFLAIRNNTLPLQIDLPRGIRYLEVIGAIGLALAYRRARLSRKGSRRTRGLLDSSLRNRALLAAGLCVLLYATPLMRSVRAVVGAGIAAHRATLGRADSVATARLEVQELLRAQRREQVRAWVPFDLDYLRALEVPLAYTWKDPWVLSYVNTRAMEAAIRVNDLAASLAIAEFDPASARELMDTAGADVAVLYRSVASPSLLASPMMRFANERYILVGRTPTSPDGEASP